jgi:hypothetical protein
MSGKRFHGIIYERHNGPIPAGMVVRHTCDNRVCINPAHLLLGTHAENVADRDNRGRTARGTKHGMAKLNNHKIREIRKSDLTNTELAKRYKVDRSAIYHVRNGSTWKHVI